MRTKETESLWFEVSLFYRSSEPFDDQGRRLFEERIIILDAADEAQAWKRAKERGPLLRSFSSHPRPQRAQRLRQPLYAVVNLFFAHGRIAQ
jgi:hypothetical protein